MLDLLLNANSDDKILNKMNTHIHDFIGEKVFDPQTAAIAKTLNVFLFFSFICPIFLSDFFCFFAIKF